MRTDQNPQGQLAPGRRRSAALDVRRDPGGDVPGLPALIEATHLAARSELAVPATEPSYLAIARLSGHLAAMRRAVCTPMRRRPGSPRELITACCAEGRRAEWSLWLLQARISGDMIAMSAAMDSVYARLAQHLTGCAAAERALVAWTEEKLSAADRDHLAAHYLACLAHGPTRPHPRGPRTGPGFRMTFAFHSAWDRVLDGMDGRPRIVPLMAGRIPAPNAGRAGVLRSGDD